jgi:hypothetical protein
MSRCSSIPALQIARMAFALAGMMLLALVALANSAQAGCGDYVFVRNANGQLVRASTLMPDHGSDCTGPECPNYSPGTPAPGAQPTTSEENLPPPLPCRGPHCSDRSSLPAFPTPSSAPSRSPQESTAILLKMNSGGHQGRVRFGVAPSSIDHELHYPQSIFHPPR